MKKYLLFLTFAFLFGGKSFAAYSGTPKTPSKVDGCYQIGSAEELYGFAELVNDTINVFTQDSKTCVKLTADIIVNENVLTDDTLNKSKTFIPWTPIKVFYGTFDGQGHTISGLFNPNKINGIGTDAGLFRSIKTRTDEDSVVIKNLNIVDSYFNGELAGAITAGASTDETGNLHIEKCSVQALVEGSVIGGFVGLVTKKITIKNSFHSGKLSGPSSASYAGGFIGLFHSGEAFIINSYHTGYAGRALWSSGLIGLIGGDPALRTVVHIENSFCIGSESLAQKKGPNNEVYITNSFCQSSISSETAKTEAEFKDGTVALTLRYGKDGDVWGQNIGTDAHPTFSGSIIGLSGSTKTSKLKFHTYEGDTATYRSEYVEGISTTLPSPSRKNYVFEGWYTNSQFTGNAVTAISSSDSGNLDFYAHWLAAPNKKDGCYEIANENDLRVFVNIVNGLFNMDQDIKACGKLTADIIWNEKIDKDARPWVPMNYFQGTLDGQGHKISGIYISRLTYPTSSYINYAFISSIFGESEDTPVTIKNIGFENLSNTACARTGGIAGRINGYVNLENIYVTGSVHNDCYASGLITSSIGASSKVSITNFYSVSQTPLFYQVSESSELSITNSFFYSPNRGAAILRSVNGVEITFGKINLKNVYISDSLYIDTTKVSVLKADSAQFANGTIAKALHDYNEDGIDGSIWGQRVGIDLYPVHSGKIDTVKITSSSSFTGKSSSSSGETGVFKQLPMANAKITTRGKTVFIENFKGYISIFDLNGNLIHNTISNGFTEIRIGRPGTYIVKTGTLSNRISLTTDH